MKKRRILALILAALTTIGLLSGCSHDKSDELTKITLNEVAHSIFYAPQYVAIELGYFKDEGIDLTVETGFGADKTMTALLSGNADIGFMGSEASIYAYAQGAKDYAVNFAQLTQRAGNFLVSRSEEPDFDWNSLKGKTVLGGRAGGMPQMFSNRRALTFPKSTLSRILISVSLPVLFPAVRVITPLSSNPAPHPLNFPATATS